MFYINLDVTFANILFTMDIILENQQLQPYNTFGIKAIGSKFVSLKATNHLETLFEKGILETFSSNILIIGGGSNILITKDYSGLVVSMETKGIEVVDQNSEHIFIKVQGGETFDDFVKWSISKNFGGVENLILIPGKVGACPIQNIGAYGSEVKDTIFDVEVFEINSGKFHRLKNAECKFGYRNSVFKNEFKNKFIITSVTFRLNKNPNVNITYGSVKSELDKQNIKNPTIKEVSTIIANIRSSKLPDTSNLGSAGSFFKNPFVEKSLLESLLKEYPNMPFYENDEAKDDRKKLAAGWLIEQCGWKGYRKNDAGVHKNQALVIVNYGNATGQEILSLSEEIMQSVKNKFGVILEREVNIV